MIRRIMIVGGIGTGALVLGIVILIGAGSAPAANCGGAGGGPTTAAGVPTQDLQYFEGAAKAYNLGSNGWAYLAGINFDESDFDQSTLPGVHSGTNSAGAAGPMQIGVGGAATDNWDTVVGGIPAGLNGGATPPSVYNEADAVYGAAALLAKWGAPGNWLAALQAWNNYPPEIQTVEQWVQKLTGQAVGAGTGTGTTTTPTPSAGSGAGTCVAVTGPPIPGAASKVEKDGLAAIPAKAPPAVQAMLAGGNQLIDYPYSWGGGHAPSAMAIPPGPRLDPGSQENGGPGYDCSSATSFVLWSGGLGQSYLGGQVFDSSEFGSVPQNGPGQWVTIYWGTSAGQGHVFIEVDGVVMDTVHGGSTFPGGTGPRWQPLSEVQYELQTGSFTAVHPPGM